MAIPYTGLFIAASCNSRFSHGRYTRSYGTVSSIGLLGQNCKHYMVVHYTFQYTFFPTEQWRPRSLEAARHQPRPSTSSTIAVSEVAPRSAASNRWGTVFTVFQRAPPRSSKCACSTGPLAPGAGHILLLSLMVLFIF